jgi:hypothetical protein
MEEIAAEEPMLLERMSAAPEVDESEEAAGDHVEDITDSADEAEQAAEVADEVEEEPQAEAEVASATAAGSSESAADVLRRLGLAAVLDDDDAAAVPSPAPSRMPPPAPIAKPEPAAAQGSGGEHYMALFQRLGVRNSEWRQLGATAAGMFLAAKPAVTPKRKRSRARFRPAVQGP